MSAPTANRADRTQASIRRTVLRILGEATEPLTLGDLVVSMNGDPASQGHRDSVLGAVRALRRRGLVREGRVNGDGPLTYVRADR